MFLKRFFSILVLFSATYACAAAHDNLPFLELISNPKKYIDDPLYLIAQHEDKEDLIQFAQRYYRQHGQLIQFLKRVLYILGQRGNVTSQAALDQIKNSSYFSPEQIKSSSDVAQNVLMQGTIEDAINRLSGQVLQERLRKQSDGTILDVFFTPFDARYEQTKLHEKLVWLIRSEQHCIRVASYYFTNDAIAYALDQAIARGVKVEVIIDKDTFNRTIALLDEAYDIPIKVWEHPRERNLKMHQKFMLFKKNINNNSIVASGSYNITDMADRQHENMIITNDPYIFDLFERRFTFIEYFAQPPVYDDDDFDDRDLQYTCEPVQQPTESQPRNRFAQMLLQAINNRATSISFAMHTVSSRKRQRGTAYQASDSGASSSSSSSSRASGR